MAQHQPEAETMGDLGPIYEQLHALDARLIEVRTSQAEHHAATIGKLQRLEKAVLDGNGVPSLMVRVDRIEQERLQRAQSPWWPALVTALCAAVATIAVTRFDSCERQHAQTAAGAGARP